MKPFPGEFTIDILNPGQGFHSSEFRYNEFKNRYSIIGLEKGLDFNEHQHGGDKNVYLLQQKSGQKRCVGKFFKFAQPDDIKKNHAIRELLISDYMNRAQMDTVRLITVFHEEELFMFYPFQQKPEEYLIGVFEIRSGGDLWSENLSKSKHLEQELSTIYRKVVQDLVYMHQTLKMTHYDIKPGNIVLSLAKNPYIIDFGAAMRDGDQPLDPPNFTPEYMSPEMAFNGRPFTCSTDLWSLGISIVETMLPNNLQDKAFPNGVRGNPSRIGLTSDYFKVMRHKRPEFFDLICRLLEFDPVKRRQYFCFNGENKIDQHPWFNQDQNSAPIRCTNYDNEINMYEHEAKEGTVDRKNPVYTVFKRRQQREEKSGRPGPSDAMTYCPKVLWASNFAEFRKKIEQRILKTHYPAFKCVNAHDPLTAYAIQYEEGLEEPDEQQDAEKLECILVFY